MMQPARPLGISILAIIELIFSALAAILGVVLAVVGGSLSSALQSAAGLGNVAAGTLTAIFSVIGGVLVVVGLVGMLIGWGLWTGRGWARIIQIIFAVLGVIGGVGSLAIGAYTGVVSLISAAVIVWYVFRPNVKAYFSKTPPAPTVPPSATAA